MLVKAVAKLIPECDFVTSMMSRIMLIHTYCRLALMLEVDGDHHIGFVIRGCPHIRCKIQPPLGFLNKKVPCLIACLIAKQAYQLLTFNIFAMRARVCLKTCLTSHDTVDGEGM